MKTIKTRSNQRDTYTYTDAMGKKVVLKPGDQDPISGAVLTEEMIQQLHRFDDNEVYNNVKNSKRPVEDWEKPLIAEWKEEHPYDELPSRSHVSLDAAGEDDDGIDDDTDKGYLGEASLVVAEKEDTPAISRLHEVIEMLEPERRLLYQRVIVNEVSMTVIAEEEGVSVTAIHNRIEKIKKFIQENF